MPIIETVLRQMSSVLTPQRKFSGKHTYGLDRLYNSKQGKAEKGLEISTLALVDVTDNMAYNLSTRQTPKLDNPEETQVDWYLKHLQQDRATLPETVLYGTHPRLPPSPPDFYALHVRSPLPCSIYLLGWARSYYNRKNRRYALDFP